MEFDLEDPFCSGFWYPTQQADGDEELLFSRSSGANQDNKMSSLFAAESEHMSSCRNLVFHLSLRRKAVSLLLQAQFSCNLDPSVIYLATNYIDRFLSIQDIPSDKPWIVWLLSMACLSLASKMNKSTHLSVLADFFQTQMGEEGLMVCSGQAIRRTEMLVLGALGWRMRSVTPFSFLRFFLSFFQPRDPPLLDSLRSRAIHIIFKAQTEMKLLEYKPSVVAASALLTASHDLFPVQFPCFRNSILDSPHVNNKETIWECCDAMEDMIMIGGCHFTSSPEMEMVSSCCDTPVTVLGDRHSSSSSESEKTAAAVGPASHHHLRLKKRPFLE